MKKQESKSKEIDTRNIWKKLHQVMQDYSYSQKGEKKRNSSLPYRYVSVDQVSLDVRQAFIKNRLVFTCSVTQINNKVFTYQTSSKDSTDVVEVWLECRIVNIDNPDEQLNFHVAGHGSDTLDKGVYKAISGAVRHGLLKFFLIPTGDDPEETEDQMNKEVKCPSPKKRQTKESDFYTVMADLKEKVGTGKFMEIIESFGYEKVEDIPKERRVDVYKALKGSTNV